MTHSDEHLHGWRKRFIRSLSLLVQASLDLFKHFQVDDWLLRTLEYFALVDDITNVKSIPKQVWKSAGGERTSDAKFAGPSLTWVREITPRLARYILRRWSVPRSRYFCEDHAYESSPTFLDKYLISLCLIAEGDVLRRPKAPYAWTRRACREFARPHSRVQIEQMTAEHLMLIVRMNLWY